MIREALPAAARRLEASSDSPRLDAEVLLAHVLGSSRAAVLAHDDDELPQAKATAFDKLVERRAGGVPVAYLTGTRGFWTLDLEVTPDVLVPRPETELLVEWGLQQVRGVERPRILDLGTGSGCIALALKKERPDAQVTALDASERALQVARGNAQRLGLEVVFERASFESYAASAAFDLVVSNPPYVAKGDPHLSALRHEPGIALVSGSDGLEAIRTIVRRADEWLVPRGSLLLEHGADQGEAVRTLLHQSGLCDVETRRDLSGLERVTFGRGGA